MSVIGYCSRGLRRIRGLDALLETRSRFFILRPPKAVTHIAGWGRKPTAVRARRFAAQFGLPFVSLEDGFLRSFGLGVNGAPLHSLVADNSGIYYDATQPSDLESLILDSEFGQEELSRARYCMEQLRQHRLSKYNCARDHRVTWPDTRPRVLVVDQTFGDAAVTYGGADAASFIAMLDAAIAENPDAQVVVKVHPDVIAGKKRGYLLQAAEQRGCQLWSEDVNPWALLDAVERVYVVTSQFGFDALLAGLPVRCFGLPFYAGWGLTEDELSCPRRAGARSLEQVFAAAYLRYCRYINPYTGERCTLEDTIRLIAEQKRQAERLRGSWLALGFSPWKRGFVPDFLAQPAQLQFASKEPAIFSRCGHAPQVAIWASSLPEDIASICSKRGLTLWRLEDGFLRSVGLGSDLVRPLSLVLDKQGIYYDASRPSGLEMLLRETIFTPELRTRGANLRQLLVTRQLSKYNVGAGLSADAALTLPANRVAILVPGQVESDASIANGSPWIKSNRQLLQQVRRANPDAYIIYKPHPDVLAGGRMGALPDGDDDLFDLQVSELPMPALLAQVDEVHTLSSLSGFEALLRGVKVVTYGLPFYAGWGLTEDLLLNGEQGRGLGELAVVRRCLRARGRKLTLDELVAATLILYPSYVDPRSGDLVDVETAVQILQAQRAAAKHVRWRQSIYRKVRNRFFRK
ncbi:capsular polysaccharide biosynthesis protein [Microbulbifer sp. YPW1]|uniref:capsular polysaccharide biosynthesis protein n=1 Tax=Microbulbifer sp. YPW1 TaxID=2745199 RepID=UPI00159B5527|nr:capsular polysaccharide biosynthesis protein [Microbulbifer sp. YPW1]QKX15822.1 capsular polysaccharide biosynthesis protein [Microbulbifer sp. YPW1]